MISSRFSELPPCNIEVEEALLGILLLNPQLIEFISNLVDADCFFSPANQTLFEAIAIVFHREKILTNKSLGGDYLFLLEYLKVNNLTEKVGGGSRLARLLNQATGTSNAERYAVLIAKHKERRDTIKACLEVEKAASQCILTVDEVNEVRKKEFDSIRQAKTEDKGKHDLGECYDRVYARLNNGETPVLSTGLKSLDEVIGGFGDGELIVLAGRPGMGKTMVATFFAWKTATQGNPVVFFSAEMDADSICTRMISTVTGIPGDLLIQGKPTRTQMDIIEQIKPEFAKLPITIYDDVEKISNLSYIETEIKNNPNTRLVLIDYLQFICKPTPSQMMHDAIAHYTKELKAMARRYSIPIVLLSQLNRGVESRADKRPNMGDLKSSGSIEQDANKIILLYRDEYYNKEAGLRGITEFIVDKNRNGSTGTIEIISDMRTGWYQDKRRFAGESNYV